MTTQTMKLTKAQIQHLNDSAELIVDQPTESLTTLWMDWGNANIDICLQKDPKFVSVENILPVLWVFSKLYDTDPTIVFSIMVRELRRRVQLLGFYQADELIEEDAHKSLTEVVKELRPVGSKQREALN